MKAGLEDVIAGESGICFIDGDKGILAYRGYNIHELATNSTFEETCHLLWFGRLPKQSELDDTAQKLSSSRAVPPQIIDFMKSVPKKALPMEVLRTTVSMLSMFDTQAEDMSAEANLRKAIRLTAQTATLVAAFDRIRNGKEHICSMGRRPMTQ
jgi:citrate synthase